MFTLPFHALLTGYSQDLCGVIEVTVGVVLTCIPSYGPLLKICVQRIKSLLSFGIRPRPNAGTEWEYTLDFGHLENDGNGRMAGK